ncbi:hypothetical protein COOONC_21295 [Cooperia oncophora]
MAADTTRYTRHFSSQCGSLYPRECELCLPRLKFHDQAHFARHLRVVHDKRRRIRTFASHYGENNVCQKLPLEGVSDDDYETHIRRVHCG